MPRFPCKDCRVNTCPVNGDREYYEVWDSLWNAAGAPGVGQADNGVFGYYLCIGCLEARIGRQLKLEDFKPFAANYPSVWLSARLNNRLLGRAWTRYQFFPTALAKAVAARGYKVITTPTGSYVEGW